MDAQARTSLTDRHLELGQEFLSLRRQKFDGDREYFEEASKKENRYALGCDAHARTVHAQFEALHRKVQAFKELGKSLVRLVVPFGSLMNMSVD